MENCQLKAELQLCASRLLPSLGMMTVNALAAADTVLIPVQAEHLPVKGLEQLLQTIAKVRRQINPHLKIKQWQRKRQHEQER